MFLGSTITDFGTGILLNNNSPSSNIFFVGGLTLNTGGNAAFTATAGGTVHVCATGDCAGGPVINTITTSTGTALNVANTNIGSSGLTFRSISANGAVNGIVLNNTGVAAGLTVTGTGTAGTGGTIQNTTGHGVSLSTTANVSLSGMTIQGSADQGIHGTGVTHFALNGVNITNNGNSTLDDGLQLGEASGSVVGVTGNVTISNSNISGNAHNNVHIRNTAGTIASFTVTNSSFNDLNDTFGANAFLFEGSGTSVLTSGSITGSTFSTIRPNAHWRSKRTIRRPSRPSRFPATSSRTTAFTPASRRTLPHI